MVSLIQSRLFTLVSAPIQIFINKQIKGSLYGYFDTNSYLLGASFIKGYTFYCTKKAVALKISATAPYLSVTQKNPWIFKIVKSMEQKRLIILI